MSAAQRRDTTGPCQPHRHSRTTPVATPQPFPHMAVAPATAQRPAGDPCHPPLALAPRRLYTSPMRNPTSARTTPVATPQPSPTKPSRSDPPQIQSNRQPHAEATAAAPKANNHPFCPSQLQKAQKNPKLSSEAKHSNQARRRPCCRHPSTLPPQSRRAATRRASDRESRVGPQAGGVSLTPPCGPRYTGASLESRALYRLAGWEAPLGRLQRHGPRTRSGGGLAPRHRGRPRRAAPVQHPLGHPRGACLHPPAPGGARLSGRHRPPRPVPLHPGRPPHGLPRQALDHAHVRGLRHPRPRPTSASSSCSTTARPASARPSTCPRSTAYDTDAPQASGEFGRCGAAVSSLPDMEELFQDIPLDQVTTSMTINSPAAIIWAMYLAMAPTARHRLGQARRHPPERHHQGVHRAERVHLSPRTVHAAGRGHHRVRVPPRPALEPRQRQRLPHPGGRRHRRPGAGVHPRRRHGLRGPRHRARP